MPSPPSDSSTSADPILPPVKLDPLAALLSYLIPGLGQVYQGRIGKGLLFFFGLYLLFFYGMWMGQWRNVWLPDAAPLPNIVIGGQQLEGTLKALAYRPQFLGQFWIGIAAWPAAYQYIYFDEKKDAGLRLDVERAKEVLKDEKASQEEKDKAQKKLDEFKKAGTMFDKFQQTPTEDELNDLQRNGSKRWDLGWVYTVIAGVLNLLVIYDAFAGPMFREPPASTPAATVAAPTATPAATASAQAIIAPVDPVAAQAPKTAIPNSNPQRGSA